VQVNTGTGNEYGNPGEKQAQRHTGRCGYRRQGLATAELLGVERSNLVGQRIRRHISQDSQDSYYLCRQLLLSTKERQSCELHMIKTDGTAVWVKASIASAESSNGDPVLRMVLTDISDAKIMALAMQESESRLRAIVKTQG